MICGAAGISTYARDLHDGVMQLFASRGTDGMRALERTLAIADLLSYAVLADGVVTEAEWAALSEALESAGAAEYSSEIGLERIRARDAALARLRARAGEVKDEDTLRQRIAAAAQGLDAADREEVFVQVLALAGAGAAAAPEERGYRGNGPADPRRLVTIFGEVLAIPPARRSEIEAQR